MASQSKGKKTSQSRSGKGVWRNAWLWVLVGVVGVLVIVFFLWQSGNRQKFTLLDGDKQVLVLIRNEEDGTYRLRYEGRAPVDLRSLQVMLGGQILHVDVMQIAVTKGGQEVVLESSGQPPQGQPITLSPGEEFDVRVTFRGESIGGNYLYGFRIGYGAEGSEQLDELIMEYDYAINVE